MVLTFALCASFAFAQTATPRNQECKAPAKVAQTQNYSSSIFTKDAVTVLSVDFSAANTGYSTGVVTGGLEGHGESYDFATWRRWANADESTLQTSSSTYSALTQNYFGGIETYVQYMGRYLDTATSSAENGWMMMSLYDQRTPRSGNFNAYILFENIDASAASVLDFNFFQYYRKYYDNCYLDYSTNGTTWNSMEINVTGIDINVNDALWGMYTYTLPIEAAGCANLSVRIRYKSLDSSRGAYGYYWIVDDVTITAGDADRLKKYDQEYTEGNYGMIPQGMAISPAWYSLVVNTGSNNQSNVEAKLYHLNATQDQATEIASFNNGSVNVSSSKEVVADPAGWYLLDSLNYRGWYGYIDHTPHGTGSTLPTATAGDNYVYANISNNVLNINYDTMYYQVTGADANGNYTWAHDNGVLTYSPYNYWLFGYVYQGGNWYVTEDPEEVHYYQAGYRISSRYTTGATVPENWVVKGVELVASPVDGYHSTGTKLSGTLTVDEYDGGSVSFPSVNTGANVKEITAADINDSNVIGRNSNGYLTNGNYNTIFISFPEQPDLLPNTSYRIGYVLEEDGYFALATEALGNYRVASPTRPDQYDTIMYFANNEATAKYANVFPVNQYQTFITDPSYGGEGNNSTFASWHVFNNPMIRMIVGPKVEMPRKNIAIECENSEYGFASYLGEDACGTTVSPVVSSTATIIGEAAAGCRAHVYVDGAEIEPWNDDEETGDPNLQLLYDESLDAMYYYYTFANINEDHNIKFVFYVDENTTSIDPVAAGVRMNLQPNPATSQVSLNIAGVTGMVNCTLVDMSGRVVYNQNINAESAQVIDLSNLAKGAYFVRITNDKFSKVEKLIVR